MRGHGLCVAAFLMWQCDIQEDASGIIPFDPVLEQVRVTTVEHLAGICFAPHIRRADAIRFGIANAIGQVDSAEEIAVP